MSEQSPILDEPPIALGEPPSEFDDARTVALPPHEEAEAMHGDRNLRESLKAGANRVYDPENEQQTLANTNRWERLKRGFWKHMYEAPMDVGPMGPIEQPAVPFDEWYAEKQKQTGRASRAATIVASKAIELTAKTAEKTGDLTAFVDYMGNVALTGIAYHARNVADEVQYQAKAAKERLAKKAKSAQEKAGAAADMFMEPSEPDPSWLDFVREANAAEREVDEVEIRSQADEALDIPGETQAAQEEKKSGKARRLGKVALKAALVAGTAYYLKRRGKHVS